MRSSHDVRTSTLAQQTHSFPTLAEGETMVICCRERPPRLSSALRSHLLVRRLTQPLGCTVIDNLIHRNWHSPGPLCPPVLRIQVYSIAKQLLAARQKSTTRLPIVLVHDSPSSRRAFTSLRLSA